MIPAPENKPAPRQDPTVNREMAVYREDDTVYYVLLEEGEPAEWMAEPPGLILHRLDIFLGQVRQVVPALSCAFVKIDDGHDAMLPLAEAPAEIKPGNTVIVQVRREAPAGKGPLVTTHIQLPGSYAVYKTHSASKRRSKLSAFPRDEQDRLFARDLALLEQTWDRLRDEGSRGSVPRLLLACGAPLSIALNTYVSPTLRRIRVEGAALFEAVFRQVQQTMPDFLPLLDLFVPTSDFGLAAVLSLSHLPDLVAKRKVWLDNGGFITIDRTEALTVIDVNSGKDIRANSGKDIRSALTGASADLRLRTNLLAAREIATQLRLRNIGGIVIIDFINLSGDTERDDVQAALEEALLADRASSRLLGFTALGLFEMTRTAV